MKSVEANGMKSGRPWFQPCPRIPPVASANRPWASWNPRVATWVDPWRYYATRVWTWANRL